MAGKYAKYFAIPEGFPEVLRNFTREVLREQPTDIESFALTYFKNAVAERATENPEAAGQKEEADTGKIPAEEEEVAAPDS